MSLSFTIRIAVGLFTLWAVVAGHSFATLSGIVILALFFSGIESVAYAVVFDILWRAPETLHAWPWLTLVTLLILWASEPVRREILA